MHRLSYRFAPYCAAILLFGALLAAHKCTAQIFADLRGGQYQQNFESLASTGAGNYILPEGFSILESGVRADGAYTASSGEHSLGDTYNFVRSLGEITSPELQSIFGVRFINRTGGSFRRFSLSIAFRQFRLGAADGVTDSLSFQYSTDATDLDNGTWTVQYNYASTVNTGPVGPMISPQNIYVAPAITLPTSVPEGGTLFFRWVSSDIPGEDDGLAVTSFMLNTLPTADFDRDGSVDGDDFLTWQRQLGKTLTQSYAPGDATGNAKVDNFDLDVWKRQFHAPSTSASTFAVPEPPPSSYLLALAMVLLLRSANGTNNAKCGTRLL